MVASDMWIVEILGELVGCPPSVPLRLSTEQGHPGFGGKCLRLGSEPFHVVDVVGPSAGLLPLAHRTRSDVQLRGQLLARQASLLAQEDPLGSRTVKARPRSPASVRELAATWAQ